MTRGHAKLCPVEIIVTNLVVPKTTMKGILGDNFLFVIIIFTVTDQLRNRCPL